MNVLLIQINLLPIITDFFISILMVQDEGADIIIKLNKGKSGNDSLLFISQKL